MQAYDVLMLIVLALAIVWGAWKGLAWQVASIASIALSYLVALRFRMPLANIINATPPWNIFLSMLILFLGTGLVVWIGFNLVSELIERVKLKEFDRQLGALFGAAKGVLLCVLVTLFSVALLGDAQRQAICNSKSGYYIAVLLDRADLVIPRELHDVLAPYLDRLDKTIPHPHTAGRTHSETAEDGLASVGRLQPSQAPPAGYQPKLLGRPQAAPPAAWEHSSGGVARQPVGAAAASFHTGDAAVASDPSVRVTRRIDAQPAPQSGVSR